MNKKIVDSERSMRETEQGDTADGRSSFRQCSSSVQAENVCDERGQLSEKLKGVTDTMLHFPDTKLEKVKRNTLT